MDHERYIHVNDLPSASILSATTSNYGTLDTGARGQPVIAVKPISPNPSFQVVQSIIGNQQSLNPNQGMSGQEITYQINPQNPYQVMSLTDNPLYQTRNQVLQSSSSDPVIIYHVGQPGFKKIAIYTLLFIILITTVINSTLIIWIISTVNFSADGIGRIRFPTSSPSSSLSMEGGNVGRRMEGESFLHRQLYANHISSPQGKTLRIISPNGMRIDSKRRPGHDNPRGIHGDRDGTSSRTSLSLDTLNSSSNTSHGMNRLFFLSPSSTSSALVSQLVIRGPDGRLLLMVDESNVHLAIDRLRVNNENGIKFNCSLQAPLVKSLKSDLRMESLTRSLDMFAPKSISFTTSSASSSPLSLHPSSSSLSLPPLSQRSSPSSITDDYMIGPSQEQEQNQNFEQQSSKISFKSLNHVSFRSRHGKILINSSNVYLDNILTVFPTKRGKTYPGIHSLCSCSESGQLFMAPAEDSCNDHKLFCFQSKVK